MKKILLFNLGRLGWFFGMFLAIVFGHLGSITRWDIILAIGNFGADLGSACYKYGEQGKWEWPKEMTVPANANYQDAAVTDKGV